MKKKYTVPVNPLPDGIIYLDYHATTPTDPRVLEAMEPYFIKKFGNPSSPHQLGQKSNKAVEDSRGIIANHINSSRGEIIFTAGATESNNIVIKGLAKQAERNGSTRNEILTSSIEHKSVLNVASSTSDYGFMHKKIPVRDNGIIDLEETEKMIGKNTLVVSVMAANNEIGVIQPIHKVAEIAHNFGALVHCDAAQAFGRMKIDVKEWGIDFLSLSAHKGYGPKGIGALYIKNGPIKQPLDPLLQGGGQEKELRPGTLNLPSIVGFGRATEIIEKNLEKEISYLANFRDMIEQNLEAKISDVSIVGDRKKRLPSTTCVCFSDVDSGALVAGLSKNNIFVSAGSACESGALEPSHTLLELGLNREKASQCIRIATGRFTDKSSIASAKNIISKIVDRIRMVENNT